MPSIPTHNKLTNCYIPLPAPKAPTTKTPTSQFAPPSVSSSTKKKRKLSDKQLKDVNVNTQERQDGRTATDQVRPVKMEVDVLSNADGSSSVEVGHTKVVCAVHGPRELSSNNSMKEASSGVDGTSVLEGGSLFVNVKYVSSFALNPHTVARQMSPVSAGGGGPTVQNQTKQFLTKLEAECSSRVYDALVGVIPLHQLTKSVMEVHLQVLQDDGGVLAACIHASVLALVDACVEMHQLVACSTVAVVAGDDDDNNNKLVQYQLLADPTETEILNAAGTVTIAMACNSSSKKKENVTFWDQSGGRLSSKASADAITVASQGCHTFQQLMQSCLLEHAKKGDDEGDDDAVAMTE
jgi:ribonuclease PH